MKIYLLLAWISYAILFMAWKKSDLPNFIIKVLLLFMAITGFIFWLNEIGVIVGNIRLI